MGDDRKCEPQSTATWPLRQQTNLQCLQVMLDNTMLLQDADATTEAHAAPHSTLRSHTDRDEPPKQQDD
jgi:hypothetical protein